MASQENATERNEHAKKVEHDVKKVEQEVKKAEHDLKKVEQEVKPAAGNKGSGKMSKPLMYALVAIVAVIIIAVAYVGVVGAQGSVVQAGDNISVYYTGTLANGTVFGTNQGQTPLVFIAGSNSVIKGFSDAVIGMRLNQTKTVTIPVNEAYGPVNPSLIVTVPLSAFGNSTIQEGSYVTSSGNGQEAEGIVTSVNSTYATVDFNPPLAGQTLTFTITVIKIKAG